MPDIRFDDFTPRSFEQFAQALTTAVMGPGLGIMGDGPDGGREAEIRGPVPYPSSSDPWLGTIVMQAKFLQRPANATSDVQWVVRQVKHEAERYAAGARDIPDRYLLITNVRLSGVSGRERKGGIEKVHEAFEKYLSPLGIQSFDVWHEQKIASLLDLYPNLMRSYAAWLGSRELLEQVYRSFADRIPNFENTMWRYVQREFRSQMHTRLQQAGHVSDQQTRLEDVFVDLPFEEALSIADPFDVQDGSGGRRVDSSGVLHRLLTLMEQKSDPKSLAQLKGPEGDRPTNRYLILGGPGQGKSTVTQFLGQIMRLRLLHDLPETALAAETRREVERTLGKLADFGIKIAGVRRYPFQIDLPSFADALSDAKHAGRSLSILEFMTQRLAASTSDDRIDVSAMRGWLAAYPFLILLDALDEVPPSGARRDVVAGIVDFWDEVGAANADVVMTVTTRPQGYNDDLDPELYAKLELIRLGPERALAYAAKVAVHKLQDEDRRELLLKRLRVAAGSMATAALMVSPLQVAILFQLIDQRGTAPTDRWTLFDEYLSVVIKREQEKAGPGGEIVSTHEVLIRRLLGRVGLLLHAEAELGGGAEAYMSREKLEEITTGLLHEDGHEGPRLTALVKGILSCATDRLVFLEQRTEGRIEFDVRSLQEFMAAAELMSGADEQVQERLRAIAGYSHWQHVYRIAASKAFSAPDSTRFRDTILTIGRQLDEEDAASRVLRPGAAIALDLLIDGLARNQPKYRRSMLAHALEALSRDELPLQKAREALGFFDGSADDLLRRHLEATDAAERRNAWTLLLACVEGGGDCWADRLVKRAWPTDPQTRLDALCCGVLPPGDTASFELFDDAIKNMDPLDWVSYVRATRLGRSGSLRHMARQYPYIGPLLNATSFHPVEAGVLEEGSAALTLSWIPNKGDGVIEAFRSPPGEAWHVFQTVGRFVETSSPETADAFVRALADPRRYELASAMELPWLLATLRNEVQLGRETGLLSAELLAGKFGGSADWDAAEVRLAERGIRVDDFAEWQKDRFVHQAIATVGAPYPKTVKLSRGNLDHPIWLDRLLQIARHTPKGEGLHVLAWILSFVLGQIAPSRSMSASEWLHLFDGSVNHERNLDPGLLTVLEPSAMTDPAILDALAVLGEAGRISLCQEKGDNLAVALTLVNASRRGGIVVVALALVAHDRAAIIELAESLRAVELDVSSPSARDAAALLQLARSSEPESLDPLTEMPGDTIGQYALLTLARHADGDTRMLEHGLAHIADKARRAEAVRREARNALKRLADSRRSSLADLQTRSALGLP